MPATGLDFSTQSDETALEVCSGWIGGSSPALPWLAGSEVKGTCNRTLGSMNKLFKAATYTYLDINNLSNVYTHVKAVAWSDKSIETYHLALRFLSVLRSVSVSFSLLLWFSHLADFRFSFTLISVISRRSTAQINHLPVQHHTTDKQI